MSGVGRQCQADVGAPGDHAVVRLDTVLDGEGDIISRFNQQVLFNLAGDVLMGVEVKFNGV